MQILVEFQFETLIVSNHHYADAQPLGWILIKNRFEMGILGAFNDIELNQHFIFSNFEKLSGSKTPILYLHLKIISYTSTDIK